MQVDPAESCRLLQKLKPVGYKCVRDGVRVAKLTWQLVPRADARVLVERRAFRQTTQRSFDHAELRFKLLVGEPFFIDTGEREQASIAAALQRKNVIVDEASNRHDAARRASLGEPWNEFRLLSICAGHNSSSG